MSVKWKNAIEQRQQELKQASLWRSRKSLQSPQQAQVLIDDNKLVNFSSNDYLGLANSETLKKLASNEVLKWGVGSGASHLVCGHQSPHHELEKSLAQFVGAERALLFSTGYMANIAVASAFTDKADLTLQDKLNHASLIDGAKLSAAQFKRYSHNNIEHAQSILRNAEFEKAMIMTDGVFSMDGDIASLKELKSLADDHDALLLVDDAHGFACIGNTGKGALELSNLTPTANVLLMATLGKAVGSFGAFVAGDAVYIEQLIQSARSYIYTTALPPAVAATSGASLKLISENGRALRQLLNDNIAQFKNGVNQIGLELLPSDSAVQPLVLKDEQLTLDFSQRLQDLGFLVSAIRPPTVPKGSARLRFTFSAAHKPKDIDDLLVAINRVAKSLGVLHDN